DRKLWSDVADLFGGDGVLAWGADRWSGRDAIRAGLEAISPEGLRHGEFHDHLQLMPVVTVEPDGLVAHARVIELQCLAVHGESAHWGVRIGTGRFEKSGGTWRIADLSYAPRLLAAHASGWAADALDAGPAAYPHNVGPAVDFAHPVTDAPRAGAGDAGVGDAQT